MSAGRCGAKACRPWAISMPARSWVCTVRDVTGGFRMWRRETLLRMPLELLRSNGYSFQIELAYVAHLLGLPKEKCRFILPTGAGDNRRCRSASSGKRPSACGRCAFAIAACNPNADPCDLTFYNPHEYPASVCRYLLVRRPGRQRSGLPERLRCPPGGECVANRLADRRTGCGELVHLVTCRCVAGRATAGPVSFWSSLLARAFYLP